MSDTITELSDELLESVTGGLGSVFHPDADRGGTIDPNGTDKGSGIDPNG